MVELQEFFAMGGYGWYVWSAYGLTFVVLMLNIVLTRAGFLSTLKSARRRSASVRSSPKRPSTRQSSTRQSSTRAEPGGTTDFNT